MTHADTPYFAAGKTEEAERAKQGILTAAQAVSSQPLRHGPYLFNLSGIRELREREVLKKESWGEWENP
jgi:hypothetical protein